MHIAPRLIHFSTIHIYYTIYMGGQTIFAELAIPVSHP